MYERHVIDYEVLIAHVGGGAVPVSGGAGVDGASAGASSGADVTSTAGGAQQLGERKMKGILKPFDKKSIRIQEVEI